MNIYLVMTLGGIIGIILHTFRTIQGANKRLKVNNPEIKFSIVFREFWTSEWLSLVGSFVCFSAMLFIASEFVNLQKVDDINYSEDIKERLLHFRMSNFIKTTSIIAGYFSDSIVYGFLGVTEKNIQKKIDELDGTKPPSSNNTKP